MSLEIQKTSIEGVLILRPKIHTDNRGYFFESYSTKAMQNAGLNTVFVQDNQSLSQSGTLRGMHFQKPPFAQAKLVRVVKGAVLDVVVDIRKNSPTYGQHVAVELTEENFLQLYVPEGFAHGFLVLKHNTIFAYKCSALYNAEAESGLLWNDEALKINWNIKEPILSDRDKQYTPFSNFISPF